MSRFSRLVLTALAMFAASSVYAAEDPYWQPKTGGWDGTWSASDKWWFPTSKKYQTWISDRGAIFTNFNATANITLSSSPTIWQFFTTSDASASKKVTVNIGGSGTITVTHQGEEYVSSAKWLYLNIGSGVTLKPTGEFKFYNNAHLKLESGAKYTASGKTIIGGPSATSNTLYIASGATATFNGDLMIGGASTATAYPTGIVTVAGGTISMPDKWIYLGSSWSGQYASSSGRGLLRVESGNVTAGALFFGGVWAKNNYTHNERAELEVRGGTVKADKIFIADYPTSGQYKYITVSGGSLQVGKVAGKWDGSGEKKGRRLRMTMTGGELALGSEGFDLGSDGGDNIIYVNGGKIRANAANVTLTTSSMTCNQTSTANSFQVGANGVTFDTGANTMTQNMCMNDRSGSTGGKVTKIGSGRFYLGWTSYTTGGVEVNAGTLDFSGGATRVDKTITVDSGAAIASSSASNDGKVSNTALVLKDGAIVEVTCENGAPKYLINAPTVTVEGALRFRFSDAIPHGVSCQVLKTTGGTFPASILSSLSVDGMPNSTFALSADSKTILCTPIGANEYIYAGGGADTNFSTPGNWLGGNVPPAGSDISIWIQKTGTINNDIEGLTPSSISFGILSAAATINGKDFTSVKAVTNLTTAAYHRFNVGVSGSAFELYSISASACTLFYGPGLSVNTPVLKSPASEKNAYSLAGIWNIAETPWTPKQYYTVRSNGKVTLAGQLKNPCELTLYSTPANTWIAAKSLLVDSGNSADYIVLRNAGLIDIEGELKVTKAADVYIPNKDSTSASGIIKCGSLVYASTVDKWLYIAGTNVVGSGGIDLSHTGGACFYHTPAAPVLYARDDGFEIKATGNKSTTQYSMDNLTVTFNTTKYGTASTPAAITVSAVMKDRDASKGWKGKVDITGCGKVVMNSVSTYSNGTDVKGTATLAINSGKQAGTGLITVANGATLSLPQTGTVTLGGNLTLNAGSTLEFKVSGESSRSVLARNSKTLTLPASGKVKVKLTSDSDTIIGQKYTLTSGAGLSDASKFELADGVKGELSVENNELVYTAPSYFYIRVAQVGNLSVPVEWVAEKGVAEEGASIESVAAKLAKDGENGIPVWQSYCMGLDPKDAENVVICTAAAEQPTEPGKVKIEIPRSCVPDGLSGVKVTAYLDVKAPGGEWTVDETGETISSGAILRTAEVSDSGISFFE